MFVFWFCAAQLNSMTIPVSQSSMLHLQSNMQHSPLGISIINTHSGSVSNDSLTRYVLLIMVHSWIKNVPAFDSQMSPFSMNGLPSPGYQCPTSVYQPASQQVYSLTQTGQQVTLYECTILTLHNNVSKISITHFSDCKYIV